MKWTSSVLWSSLHSFTFIVFLLWAWDTSCACATIWFKKSSVTLETAMTASAETFWTSSLSFIILFTDAFGSANDFSADMIEVGPEKKGDSTDRVPSVRWSQLPRSWEVVSSSTDMGMIDVSPILMVDTGYLVNMDSGLCTELWKSNLFCRTRARTDRVSVHQKLVEIATRIFIYDNPIKRMNICDKLKRNTICLIVWKYTWSVKCSMLEMQENLGWHNDKLPYQKNYTI